MTDGNRIETPVSKAFASLRDRIIIEGPDEAREEWEFLFGTLAHLAHETEQETKSKIADRLDELGEGRLEYVHNRNPRHSGEIEAMGGMQGTIYGEATGAKWLARIVRGESDKGWLPSWRWGK